MDAANSSFPCLDFLDGLSAEDQREVAQASTLRRFRTGQRVFAYGEPMQGLMVISQGHVKFFRRAGRGHVQTVETLGPGDCLGEATIFGHARALADSEACDPVVAWVIPSEVMLRLFRDHPAMAEPILRRLHAKLARMMDLVELLSLHNVLERVAQLIVSAHDANPAKPFVEFHETQQELAEQVGSSREAFSRALRSLTDLGLVQNTFPVVRLKDLDQLRRMAVG